MKRNVVISLVVMFSSLYSFGGDGQYAVKSIPENLTKNAHIIKRYEELRFELIDLDKAKKYHKYVITVLDEKGDDHAKVIESYDKNFWGIPEISGRLYDNNGVKIKTLKGSDVQDYSNTSESTLADDSRVRVHSFNHKIYPYTVEYEVEQQYKGTMFFPTWDPVEYFNSSIELSVLQVICPSDYKLRFKSFNFPNSPVETVEKEKKIYKWEIKNFASLQSEYSSADWEEIAPVIYLAPTEFQMQGYKGNMSSWEEFGKFTRALLEGRDRLPEDIKAKVHQLTDKINDPKKKIAVLYEFMQQNTRYVNISLGIGGWQPFDATYVATKRYGDCKALSNYMSALLKEANIPSYYTLVKSGEGNTFYIPDFPSRQSNHIILCVPLQKDTVWLECTSQILPAGYLSAFTADRYVLLIKEKGGQLVRTPKYGLKDNMEIRYTNATIDAEGHLKASCKTDYSGLQQDDIYELINSQTREKIMEWLKKSIDLPQYDVVKFDYQQQKTCAPVVTEELELTANSYAQVSGKRLFVTPNILTKTHRKLTADDARKYELVMDNEYWDIDTVEIKIPSGYQPESIPQPVNIDSKFGKYINSIKVNGDKIVYYRSYQYFSGRFPPSAYNELVKFYDQVYKADRNKVVMVKPE